MIRKISSEDFELIRKRVNTNIAADINEFIASGDSACEVVTDDYKTVESAYNAYRVAAKRSGYGIKFIKRGNRIFMYKEDTDDAAR